MRERYVEMRRRLIEFAALDLRRTGKPVDPGVLQAIAYCDSQVAGLDIADLIREDQP